MLPDRVSNLGPLTYESGALPTALRGPARNNQTGKFSSIKDCHISSLHFEIQDFPYGYF